MIEDAITADTFYRELKHRFSELLENEGILKERVEINTRSLTPEEAIGITERRDFPIITGKDVMVQAECMGALGQAFTDAPSVFKGTLQDICALDIEKDSHDRGLFIAALNAVMKHLGKVECTVHCRNNGPEQCAVDAAGLIECGGVYFQRIRTTQDWTDWLPAVPVRAPVRTISCAGG